MADAIFRADLIEALERRVGRGAAVQAAEIMLGDASNDQIDEVRDLLPEDLKFVVSAGREAELRPDADPQFEGLAPAMEALP